MDVREPAARASNPRTPNTLPAFSRRRESDSSRHVADEAGPVPAAAPAAARGRTNAPQGAVPPPPTGRRHAPEGAPQAALPRPQETPVADVAAAAAAAAAVAVPAAMEASRKPVDLAPPHVPGALAMFGNICAAVGCTFVFSAPMAFVFAMMAAAYTWYIAAQSGMRMLAAAPAMLQLTCQNMRAEFDHAVNDVKVLLQSMISIFQAERNQTRAVLDQLMHAAHEQGMPLLVEANAAARSIGGNLRAIMVTAAKCTVAAVAAVVGMVYAAPFVTAGVASALSAEALAGVFGGPIGIGCAVGAMLVTLLVAYGVYRWMAARAAAAQAAQAAQQAP